MFHINQQRYRIDSIKTQNNKLHQNLITLTESLFSFIFPKKCSQSASTPQTTTCACTSPEPTSYNKRRQFHKHVYITLIHERTSVQAYKRTLHVFAMRYRMFVESSGDLVKTTRAYRLRRPYNEHFHSDDNRYLKVLNKIFQRSSFLCGHEAVISMLMMQYPLPTSNTGAI